jgi:hypothetical protein
MAMRWVHEHLFLFLTALLFVMMDLTGEVCLSLYLHWHSYVAGLAQSVYRLTADLPTDV